MVNIDLQIAVDDGIEIPTLAEITAWAQAALDGADYKEDSEITVRFVSPEEIHELNHEYRGMDKATNILSFPFECPPEVKLPLLGDLVICSQVLQQEAQAQSKSLKEHCAHLIVHGCLHLLGYDHIEEDEAVQMETLESRIVMGLGYADPYAAEKES